MYRFSLSIIVINTILIAEDLYMMVTYYKELDIINISN